MIFLCVFFLYRPLLYMYCMSVCFLFYCTFTTFVVNKHKHIITGPPSGPVLFCWLASVVCRLRLSASLSVTLSAGRRVGGWPPLGRVRVRLTLHGGPVRLRPFRATPC